MSSERPMTSCAIDAALVLSENGFAEGTVLVEGRQSRRLRGLRQSAKPCGRGPERSSRQKGIG